MKSSFNYDLTDKRVLNMENVVNDDDNIKQDISIDVYGRSTVQELQTTQEEAPAAQPAAEAEDEEEEDEMDALLSA